MVLPNSTLAPFEKKEIPELMVFQENTLKEIANPIYSKPLIFASLIDCLIEYESKICKDKERCVGDKGTSFGCLQFKRETFKEYCIDKYRLASSLSEIFNCEIQKKCADLMIKEGKAYLWSTIKYCQK